MPCSQNSITEPILSRINPVHFLQFYFINFYYKYFPLLEGKVTPDILFLSSFPDPNTLHSYNHSHAFYMPTATKSLFILRKNISATIKFTKFLITQFSLFSCFGLEFVRYKEGKSMRNVSKVGITVVKLEPSATSAVFLPC
jgi:hypothetical protein